MKQAYMSGFGNEFSSEALVGALPQGRNSPQRPPYGLYPEQISGSAFTAPRDRNLRSWMYRILPSVRHSAYQPWQAPPDLTSAAYHPVSPQQQRWDAPNMPDTACDWLSSLKRMALNGSAASRQGSSVYVFACNRSMQERFFQSADGEWLLIPQQGGMRIDSEFGRLDIDPGSIAVIPRGIRFQVHPLEGECRGYACENWGAPFRLPDLGPIGANGLANPRDFEYPVAAYVEKEGKFELITKILDRYWICDLAAHPCNVVAWHGNYAPYRYNLKHFNTMNTVSFDHPDPSIFTVLTSPTDQAGTANIDFVIFPERWMVAEDTFRPPWFHRNIMSEYMGLIEGNYDAKGEGFSPGCSSLHNCMSAHGPDARAVSMATEASLVPQKQCGTLAFMLESSLVYQPSDFALHGGLLQSDYLACWEGLQSRFHDFVAASHR